MPTLALLNAFLYAGSHDLTGESNRVALAASATANDRTTFRSNGWSESSMGGKSATVEAAGFWQSGADTIDEYGITQLSSPNQVMTIGDSESESGVAYMLQGVPLSYAPLGGSYGENSGFTINGRSTDGLAGIVRGSLLKKFGTVSAVGQLGTVVQLGAVGAAQFLYGAFHVFGTPGTTITAVLESATTVGMAGAVTRMTFGPYTTAGGRWATRVPGAITDTFWRYRVTAITGTFTVAAAAGIQ